MNEKQFAKLVEERPDLAEYFQFMSPGKDGRRGYYRRIPETFKDRRARPASQLRSQIALSEAAHGAYGKRGFAEDGTPIVADEVRRKMKRETFREPAYKKAIRKLTEAMKQAAEIAATTET